jgi:hypothetical protein
VEEEHDGQLEVEGNAEQRVAVGQEQELGLWQLDEELV